MMGVGRFYWLFFCDKFYKHKKRGMVRNDDVIIVEWRSGSSEVVEG